MKKFLNEDAYCDVKRKNKFTKYHYIYVNTKLGTGRMKVHILFPSSELSFFVS